MFDNFGIFSDRDEDITKFVLRVSGACLGASTYRLTELEAKLIVKSLECCDMSMR